MSWYILCVCFRNTKLSGWTVSRNIRGSSLKCFEYWRDGSCHTRWELMISQSSVHTWKWYCAQFIFLMLIQIFRKKTVQMFRNMMNKNILMFTNSLNVHLWECLAVSAAWCRRLHSVSRCSVYRFGAFPASPTADGCYLSGPCDVLHVFEMQ